MLPTAHWDYVPKGGWVTGEPRRKRENSLTELPCFRSFRDKGREVPGAKRREMYGGSSLMAGVTSGRQTVAS